jgi:FAD/FMN-containing dehydrogenase/ferredoxin
MAEEGVGPPIYRNNNAAPPPPTEFSAKEERSEGRLAAAIRSLGLKDVRIISSSGERMLYSRDQSEIPRFMKEIMFRSAPTVVVQPKSEGSVSALLKLASSRHVPVIPRGSGSSPFGGSAPVVGGMVLDASVMDEVLSIDVNSMTARVQGGTRWADLDHELEKLGLALNTCPSSKFSTVAGWIATGGMGLNSYSKGHIKESVLSLTLVTSDGSVRKIARSDPLFPAVFGSEGQLGVITEVTLSVRKKPEKSTPHMIMFGDFRSALSFANALGSSEVHPAHIVYESPLKFSLINRMLGGERFTPQDGIIVSIEGKDSENQFQQFLKSSGLKEEKEYLARYMWNERFFPMKMRKYGPGLLGSEVVVPMRILPDALQNALALCKELGLEPLFEVHFLNDGNGLLLCYYITDQGNTISFTLDAAKSLILTSMLIDGGAKPYSIGIWNTAFTSAEDRAKLTALRVAKVKLDPGNVMNAGKYFFLSGRFGGVLGTAFSPGIMRPALKTMRVFSPLTMRLMRTGYKFAERKFRPKARTELLKIADECAMCGACVGVCPAYLIVGDERVTARGKLLAIKTMARGQKLTKEHSDRIFLCMRCKACEQICQSKLALIDTYDKLEKELEALHGKDAAEIEKFIRYAECQPDFDRLVERGLVIGAPKHGMGGGQSEV